MVETKCSALDAGHQPQEQNDMDTIRITFEVDTNIDPETLRARVVAAIGRGEPALEDNVREYCEADPDTVTVTVID